ncbi:MAG TPA: globin family protein [Polyangia bacterium]|jgi:hemoglobin-like flavoprotein|nr:globin family protein [Polyangia bacterium]
MTSEQKALVQTTFAQVVPISAEAAKLFYGRLFELNPALRVLFKSDLHEQGKKLMQTLGFCVSKLDQLETILPAVRDLGKRHAQYGVADRDYDTVASALLWTLEQGLGPSFTPEVKAAWTEVYVALATTMKEAARA